MSEFMDVYTRASKTFRAVTDAALRRHGLHLGQNLVLAALHKNDGQTPGAIAAAVNVTTPTIVKMATRMTAAGLLTRRRDDRDNRLVRLYLTDEGRLLHEPVEQELLELEQHLTKGISLDEVRHLMDILTRVADNAQALGDTAPEAG
ncbi:MULTISPECIES: MarR family winged helix-turn-helix transcriptional regulator [unclassified Streptomyces]|uniref:MarR family winged helix-turn-helix transcriptional regulator n=1 Tax=unclassified Streptomyces TaxID=2593676 RepID=UPI0022594665|nr:MULTISPECIES: MarR family winged helix-turn-helix transcriptional regulator [unclassified Streptomyces]WSP53039.1 MarR family winged helix-turn-helix transcriptional regulator [Streptomyces sp. NBC_01241]WSU19636.1 MarR family winged helix-turn-helix transcriptional regulator [Streptomyces sp. NBC_01108]MCX4800048.1 MarR family winged helix-turn-helix transcriptional regulator [Streptomyces sp. NBC_01242]WSJ40763.1 MarR family winged helix-turn-helix transcriptional regulator [Streptomyces s